MGASGNRAGGKIKCRKVIFYQFINQSEKLYQNVIKTGKTQTLNFYIINDELHFVDVPGYGFAKVSKSEREAWGE